MNKRKDIILNNLKEYRLKAGLTQKQVAQILNVSEERVSHWEKGNNAPAIENLLKLSELYNTQISELYSQLVIAISNMAKK